MTEPRFTPFQRWLASRRWLIALTFGLGFVSVPIAVAAWAIPTQRSIDARFEPVEVTVVTDPVFRGAAVADVTFTAPDGTFQRAETPVPTNPGIGDRLVRYWDTRHDRLWFRADGSVNPNIHRSDTAILAAIGGVVVAVFAGGVMVVAHDSAAIAQRQHERFKQRIVDEIAAGI